MPDNLLVFYGSYRATRVGIRMATFVVNELRARGAFPELIDAREVGLPIIDRMYKEFPKGTAPKAMEDLAAKIRAADAFVFVVGEYNWGPQPGLKNLTDHFLEEWYWRPAAVVSYSPGRLSGARAGSAWHPILSEMGMVVVSSTVAVGPIAETLDAHGAPVGEAGRLTQKAFSRVADDLAWWTSAARNEHLRKKPPY
ncbi:MAG TPA: NAD(P)H-dependent oxidoreductase [Rhizomicrobium sp.]|jgi:NAD(P)H-dependent FMN reductase|nr:NAD(P)H-dependent oxidoreductase [Rhizomicrobium sp.]